MTTNVWISCKKGQVAADAVIHRLLDSNWSVSSPGKGKMIHGAHDTCIQIVSLEMEGTPKNGCLSFTDWITQILKAAPVEDFSVIVKTWDGISSSTAWNVGQGTTPVQKSELQKKKLKEPEKEPEKAPEKEEEEETKEETKPKENDIFNKIMNDEKDDQEEDDISYKLRPEELRIIQRVMSSSIKLSEVFFDDDVKTRQKTLKAISKVLDSKT